MWWKSFSPLKCWLLVKCDNSFLLWQKSVSAKINAVKPAFRRRSLVMRIKFKFKRKKCPLQVVPSMSQTATSSESSCHCCNCCCDLISSTNSCCCDCCCCCRTAGPFPGPCLGDGRNSLDIYDSITDLFSYPGATMGSGGGGSCSVFKHWTSQRHQSHPHQQHYHCNYNHHHCSNHCKCNQYYNTKQTAAVKPKLECHLTKKPDGNKLCPEVASDKQQQHTSLPNLPSGNCAKGSACQPLPSRPKHRPPRRSTSMISINRISSSRLLLGSLLILQIVSASAMLDALKALFILTGASTYLGKHTHTRFRTHQQFNLSVSGIDMILFGIIGEFYSPHSIASLRGLN